MADDAVKPGLPGPIPPPGSLVEAKPDTAVRPGAPGKPTDVVHISRIQPTKKVEKPAEIKDPYREIIETVVFVVVLVFMLKTFLAEAFVIPTGSMATTLLGYHRDVVCQQCRFEYRVNCSSEAEPQNGRDRVHVVTSDCPNCRYRNTFGHRIRRGP